MDMIIETASPCWTLRYESLFRAGSDLVFRCDKQGHVDLDSMSETARSNYLYARVVVGHEFSPPKIVSGQ